MVRPPVPDPLNALAEAVARLSRLLTKERGRIPSAYLGDAALRNAYLRYFLPANLPKIKVPLTELALHPSRPLARPRLRVADIGSGPGTSLFGVMEHFGELPPEPPVLELTAVDHVKQNLSEAEVLFRERAARYRGTATLRTVVSDAGSASSLLAGPFDLVLLSNVLNELFSGDGDRTVKRFRLLETLLRGLLAPDGSCIIIEPALRATSRDLLELRDRLLAAGWHIYAPCLSAASCPALADPKDWCHEDRPWNAPEIVTEIDGRTGLRKDSLKFSYLVLRHDGIGLADVAGADAWRVVSEPLVSKGKTEFFLCGKEGRLLAARQNKDASLSNEAFSDMRRGDVVRFTGLERAGKRLRVTRDTQVIVLPGLSVRETGP